MNHQETVELLAALTRAGVKHFKTHDVEISFDTSAPKYIPPTYPTPGAPIAHEDTTEKLKGLIETLKMDDSQLLDKIFPAGAGG